MAKMVGVPFLLCPKLFPSPSLQLDGVDVLVRNWHKCLGVIFDKELMFVPHLNILKQECLKSADISTVLSHIYWGASIMHLLGQG